MLGQHNMAHAELALECVDGVEEQAVAHDLLGMQERSWVPSQELKPLLVLVGQ